MYHFASPHYFFRVAQLVIPYLAIAFVLSLLYGLYAGFYLAPADYLQGEAFRIIYLHVPAAFLSLSLYFFMASCALASLVWRVKLADYMMQAAAPVGATMALIALLTGSIWGKPMWGTWWIWDARLTSELILLLLYLGVIQLRALLSFTQATKACALLVLIGAIDLPIIHYSVQWWSTLHQGPTVTLWHAPKIAWTMLYPLLWMLLSLSCYATWIVLIRTQSTILKHEADRAWTRALV